MSEKQNLPAARQLDLHALDAVLNSFVQTAQSESTTRDELYETFHPRLVTSTDAFASAVFSKRPGSQFTMVSQAGWRQLDSQSLVDIKDSIKQQYNHPQPSRSLPNSTSRITTFVGRTKPVEGVEFLAVLVRKKDADPLVEQLIAELINEVANQIETYEIRRCAGQRPKVLQDLTHLVQLTQNVAKAGSWAQLTMHLVNDLAKATQADRVCFFNPNGRLLAVSGVSQVALKTNLARSLSRLARVASKNRSSIESTADQVVLDTVRKQQHIKQWLEELDSEVIYVCPLEHDRRSCGVVSFEYFQSVPSKSDWVDRRNLISQSIAFLAPIVDRAMQINTIPGIRTLDFLFNKILRKPIRLALWLVACSLLLIGGMYLLFWVERPFEVHAEGVLQPRNIRHVFSPSDGEIVSLLVHDASPVEADQLLIVVESKTLSDQLLAVEGELAETNQELQNILLVDPQQERSQARDEEEGVDQQTQAAAEVERLKAKTATLQKRLSLLTSQVLELRLTAPIRGQVTTSDVEQRLISRPVNRGDLLMSIAEMDGEWEIEMRIPDNRLEFIRSATSPQLRFRLAASSEQVYRGELREYDFRAQPHENQTPTTVRVLVDFEESELTDQLRLGSRVVAKIDCGKKNNWFLLTYELKNKLNEWFFW